MNLANLVEKTVGIKATPTPLQDHDFNMFLEKDELQQPDFSTDSRSHP